MDIGRLRALRELAVRKTMSAVAEALCVTPSAISQQIALLEEEAGLPLVERRGRGVRLTAAGERLASHAERIITVVEEARAELAALKQVVSGELRVAAFPSAAAVLIPPTMKALEAQYPRLMITLQEMEAAEGLAALRAWQVDAALIDDLTITPALLESNVDTAPLMDDWLCAVLPGGHRLAARGTVSIGDLRDERWAVDSASAAFGNVIRGACHAAGFEPTINAGFTGLHVVLALVEAECSISILPGLIIGPYAERLCIRRIAPGIRRRISVATRRSERTSPAIGALLGELVAQAARRFPPGG